MLILVIQRKELNKNLVSFIKKEELRLEKDLLWQRVLMTKVVDK